MFATGTPNWTANSRYAIQIVGFHCSILRAFITHEARQTMNHFVNRVLFEKDDPQSILGAKMTLPWKRISK